MSITVRLIFWGLIGFVPNPQGHDGLAALLVDTQKAQEGIPPSKCGVPNHIAAVYLLDGDCEGGTCTRKPDDRKGDFRDVGLDQNFRGKPLPLAWLLGQEELSLAGEEKGKIKFRKPFLGHSHKIAPKTSRQAAYFSWIPSMDSLTNGHGQVRPSCLAGGDDCPVRARFFVPGGRAGACHLLHDPAPKDSKDSRQDVKIFKYTAPGQPCFEQAVADALLVELKVKSESVTLLSQSFSGDPRATFWARLKPDHQGKITLVVGNFPPHNAASHGNCAFPHSDLLRQLLLTKPAIQFSRADTHRVQKVVPGSCELEATELADLLAAAGSEHPHAGTACDPLSLGGHG